VKYESGRHLCHKSDSEIVALFMANFGRLVNLDHVVCTTRPFEWLIDAYQDAFTRIDDPVVRHGYRVLQIHNATSGEGKIGKVLAIDMRDVRLWTFLQ
jgi:hypothetical protein